MDIAAVGRRRKRTIYNSGLMMGWRRGLLLCECVGVGMVVAIIMMMMWAGDGGRVESYRLSQPVVSVPGPQDAVLVVNHLYPLQLLLLLLPPPQYPPPAPISLCPQPSSSPPPLPASPNLQTSCHAPSSIPHHSTLATSSVSSLLLAHWKENPSPLSSPTTPDPAPIHESALALMNLGLHYTS